MRKRVAIIRLPNPWLIAFENGLDGGEERQLAIALSSKNDLEIQVGRSGRIY